MSLFCLGFHRSRAEDKVWRVSHATISYIFNVITLNFVPEFKDLKCRIAAVYYYLMNDFFWTEPMLMNV